MGVAAAVAPWGNKTASALSRGGAGEHPSASLHPLPARAGRLTKTHETLTQRGVAAAVVPRENTLRPRCRADAWESSPFPPRRTPRCAADTWSMVATDWSQGDCGPTDPMPPAGHWWASWPALDHWVGASASAWMRVPGGLISGWRQDTRRQPTGGIPARCARRVKRVPRGTFTLASPL